MVLLRSGTIITRGRVALRIQDMRRGLEMWVSVQLLEVSLRHEIQVQFIGDGTKFVSCSYDHHVNYWDTETGKIIRKFDLGSSCYNLAVIQYMQWLGTHTS